MMIENDYRIANMASNTNQNEYLFFDAFEYDPDSETGFLSLSYPAPINDGLMTHQSVSHMLAMRKSQFTNDDETFDAIYYEDTGLSGIKDYLTTSEELLKRGAISWTQYKAYLISKGLEMKFTQNPELITRLIETNSKQLINTNVESGTLGILFTEEDSMLNREAWGPNKLGTALMVMRHTYTGSTGA